MINFPDEGHWVLKPANSALLAPRGLRLVEEIRAAGRAVKWSGLKKLIPYPPCNQDKLDKRRGAASGKDLRTIATRDEVHEQFGEPCRTGTANGQAFEDYRTRRKIAEPDRAAGMGMSQRLEG